MVSSCKLCVLPTYMQRYDLDIPYKKVYVMESRRCLLYLRFRIDLYLDKDKH